MAQYVGDANPNGGKATTAFDFDDGGGGGSDMYKPIAATTGVKQVEWEVEPLTSELAPVARPMPPGSR